MIKCASCGYSWLESRVIDINPLPDKTLPAVVEHGYEPEGEVRRLVEANRTAQENFALKRSARNRRIAGWSAVTALLLSPLAIATAFPAAVVSLAPATIAVYQRAGWDINVYGLDVRRVEMQHMIVDGTRVLAVKGEIANISGTERKIPSLRFGLRAGNGTEVYQWTLDSGARPLQPGESTNFVTRVASPPETAKNIEIRFAHADEIGSIAAP